MNEKKIAFIICANDDLELQECEHYINRLVIPDSYDVELLFVWDAVSMTSGYQEAMNSSDAKYKVYLHQDVFIINPNFIADMLDIFIRNPQIGLLGCVGATKIMKDKLPIHSWDTGKLFHNLIPSYIDYCYSVGEGSCQKVQMVDGLLMATQYDIGWREDLFRGWDFYDGAQAMEMHKAGWDVAVPYQKTPWCYHDNKVSRMKGYYQDFNLFLQEYLNESADIAASEQSLEFEVLQEKLQGLLDVWLEEGQKRNCLEIFKEEENRKYLSLREYRVLADIEQQERLQSDVRFWTGNMNQKQLFQKLQRLRFLLKRLEFDAEDGAEYADMSDNYSLTAVSVVVNEYIWEKGKVADKIRNHQS